jgi:hypothetical protein
MNHPVSAIAVNGSGVYVGGEFTTAGGVPANHIAKWDGSSWSALGSGLSGYFNVVSAIAVSGSEVYAGGFFTSAGGVPANYIAKWDGASWSALGSGMNHPVSAIAVNGSGVYVGGYFNIAGGKPSSHFGRYVLNAPPTVAAGGPYDVNEGGSVTLTASGNDPENGPLTYTWDLDNNGSFETSGQSVNFSAAALDGPSTHTIRVEVIDDGGLTASDEATVNVLNVAPTADFTGTPSTLLVGESATLAFGNPFDPGAADMAAGFQYSYDCTNDGTFELEGASDAAHTCAYPTAGTFAARGRIADQDGGFTDYTLEVIALTPQEGIEGLIDLVRSFNLPHGTENSLVVKLQHAVDAINAGDLSGACDQLAAFIHEVNAQAGKKLTLDQANQLIAGANQIRTALGCQ